MAHAIISPDSSTPKSNKFVVIRRVETTTNLSCSWLVNKLRSQEPQEMRCIENIMENKTHYCWGVKSRSENLVLDQLIIPKLVFFFILIPYLVDIVLILLGEILSWSLMGVKGLRKFNSRYSGGWNKTGYLKLTVFFFSRQLDAAKFMDVEIAVRVLYMVGEAMSVRGSLGLIWNTFCFVIVNIFATDSKMLERVRYRCYKMFVDHILGNYSFINRPNNCTLMPQSFQRFSKWWVW